MQVLQGAVLPPAHFDINGIATKLQEIYPNNEWTNYVQVNVSSSNKFEGRDPINLINRSHIGDEIKDRWCADPQYENPYIIVSFPKFYIIPFYYMLKSPENDNLYSLEFNVSISNDKIHWMEISTEIYLF